MFKWIWKFVLVSKTEVSARSRARSLLTFSARQFTGCEERSLVTRDTAMLTLQMSAIIIYIML